jgi:serine protease Do
MIHFLNTSLAEVQEVGGRQAPQKQTGLGSGVILNDEGYIMTNHHVVKDMDKLTVKLKNQKTFEAKLIGSDEMMDIALLKIQAPKDSITPITLGNSEKVRVGNWAIAIGAPLGFEQSFTVGVVSAIQRAGLDSSGLSYIQTDAAINQGNSGGPLLNIHGEVIGVNRMIASQSGGSVGIGFAIPINEAKRIADELKSNGKSLDPGLEWKYSPSMIKFKKNSN